GTDARRAGRNAEAIASYSEAVRIAPGIPRAHYNLANALADAGEIERAIREYEATLELDPAHGAAHHSVATVLRARGEKELALRQFRTADALLGGQEPGAAGGD